MRRLRAVGRILSWIVSTWPRRSKRRNPIEEVHGFFAERLTESGKSVGFLWLASLPVAMLPGSAGWVVFALLTALMGACLAATLFSPALDVEYLGAGRAVAGADVDLKLRVTNRSVGAVRWAGAGLFRAENGLERRDRIAQVETLDAGDSIDLTISVKCLSRGPTGFPGVGAVRSDGFGLTRARRIDFAPLEVLVAPEPLRIVPSTFLFGGTGGRAFLEAVGWGNDAERIFQGVRAFRDGDRLRDLDHKAWARWNAPVVREFASAPARGVAISVETGCEGLLERSLLEPMLRLACGIAVEFCRRGWLGGLFVDGVAMPVRCDREADVERVFAGAPRCGWGAWPRPAEVHPRVPQGMPLLSVAVSARQPVSESVESATPIKRVLLVSGRGADAGESGTLHVAPRDLDGAEVVL